MFESPATDFIEKDLDLNTYLVKRKSSTFFYACDRLHA